MDISAYFWLGLSFIWLLWETIMPLISFNDDNNNVAEEDIKGKNFSCIISQSSSIYWNHYLWKSIPFYALPYWICKMFKRIQYYDKGFLNNKDIFNIPNSSYYGQQILCWFLKNKLHYIIDIITLYILLKLQTVNYLNRFC